MRPLTLMLLGCLLLGCSSPPLDGRPAPAPADNPVSKISPPTPEVSGNVHRLSGTLLTPATGSLVELAILLVDAQGRPRGLLESYTLTGTGEALPFELHFSAKVPPADLRLQLRARVSVSGGLVQRLPGQFIQPGQNTNLGTLQLVSAP